jgi:nucleotide-binding universal stress UspA family protein
MKKILVPTDFSTNATRAIDIAMAMGASSGAELILFHSSNPNEGINNTVYSPIFVHEYYEVKKQTLERLADQLKEKGYTGTISTEYVVDFTVSALLDTADKHDVDVIVMGATGSSSIHGMILGSVSAGVIERSKIPVFLVPHEFSLPETKVNVFIATDYKTAVDEKAKTFLRFLKEKMNFDFTLVHVDNQEKDIVPDKDFIKHNFEGIVSDQLEIQGTYVSDALIILQEETPNSILCTIKKHRGWFEKIFSQSITKSLAHHARVPLICLQEAN